MSVHYKFKSALDYDTVTFDGLHISIGDLKAAISQQKRIGKTSDFDLQITNAQTKEVYTDDSTLIPKNTSLLVARVPLAQQPKKQWEGTNNNVSQQKDVSANKGQADLYRMEGSEQDKINAMITQSTFDYDPSNYQKIRGQNQRGVVPPNYTCFKCKKKGHWIKDCPVVVPPGSEPLDIRRSTGIPRSFMIPVDNPKAPGAMMTPAGTFAVPVVDREAYIASASDNGGPPESSVPVAPEPTIPDELICNLCRDILTDAVMIPCCGNSFCDECIRGALLESEDHECPDCRDKDISPTTLIPNRFLRNAVSTFRNETGYIRRVPHRPAVIPPVVHQPLPLEVVQPPASNGLPIQVAPIGESSEAPKRGPGSDSEGSDNITVTVPPAHAHRPRQPAPRRHANKYDRPIAAVPVLEPNLHRGPMPSRLDEQRSSTPTIDERRDPVSAQMVYPRPSQPYKPAALPPAHRYEPGYRPRLGPPMGRERHPLDYQPPPPGIKDSPPTRLESDPLEAFNRMIREKEARAKRREEERRRLHSPSPRSPRSPRSPLPPRSPRSPRSPRPPRSPRMRSPRSPSRSRSRELVRFSRSRSKSRGRLRRSPWSPRRRPRTRDRSLSFSRSPSPRRRPRTPPRFRSSPGRSPARGSRSPPPPPPHRSSLHRSPPPRRSPLHRSPPHRSPLHRSSPPRALSPRLSPRYASVYNDLLSPPRRSVEPPYGARYPRNNGPPPLFGPPSHIIPKNISHVPHVPHGGLPPHPEPPGVYRGRYDPPFEDIPPGIDPPIPGYEPSPFEKPPSFGLPGLMDRERLPPPTFRPQPFPEVPPGYLEPIPTGPKEIPVQVGEQPARYRDGYRGGPPFREQGYRDGLPYRDPGYRGAPPTTYRDNFRNAPFRDGPPGGFRETHYRDGPPGPYRGPGDELRDPPGMYHDPNFRENYRDVPPDMKVRDPVKGGRARSRPRRGPNGDYDRHRDRDRDNRDREPRDQRDVEKRNRDPDKNYEKSDHRDDRPRDDRYRDYERGRDRDRDYEVSQERKVSPKFIKNTEKRRSESRGRSRERTSKRIKKEERGRDKSSTERSRDRKDKEKKIKDKKKKKREKEKEKEKEVDKKKKREKKEKKEKEVQNNEETNEKIITEFEKETNKEDIDANISSPIAEEKERPAKLEAHLNTEVVVDKKPKVDELYGDETDDKIDKNILKNYVTNTEKNVQENEVYEEAASKDESFDGVELQIQPEELELKLDVDKDSDKEMFALMPELSKWEVEDDGADKTKEPGEISSHEEEESGDKVTSEIIKRAEKAIFTKTIAPNKPIEIKKISSDRLKQFTDDNKKSMNNIQITVPVADSEHRSIEIQENKKGSKTPPRLSIKERLGNKVVHSTVERIKSKSKTPKRDHPYRRVTIDRTQKLQDKLEGNAQRRLASEAVKADKSGPSKRHDKKEEKRRSKDDKIKPLRSKPDAKSEVATESQAQVNRERKKSTLDEAHFEPDYDETLESETEVKGDLGKKRERSKSPGGTAISKKIKIGSELSMPFNIAKKRTDSASESSSSESSSSSSSSDGRKRKRKKKHTKRKKKRAATDSDSDSDSSSDDHKKKKKKRKHKKKSSKKKKKSKHK